MNGLPPMPEPRSPDQMMGGRDPRSQSTGFF